MANSLTLNNITFNSIENVLKTGSKFTIVQRSGSAGTIIDDAAEEYRNIQSVLIDWNGAQVTN